MRCQDCGSPEATTRMIVSAGACCPACWRHRDSLVLRRAIREGVDRRTDANFHASRTLFAAEAEPELSVEGWLGGAA